MMRATKYLDLRWVLLAALVPLISAALFVLGVEASGLARYDPVYFVEPYLSRYDSPGAVARALEGALQEDDRQLLGELHGLCRPVAFEANPHIILIMLWEQGDRYFTYMYQDIQTLERYPHYVEKVEERWVVTPADAYYYLHSRHWLKVAAPLATVWWLVEVVIVLAVLVFRVSARLRGDMYGGEYQDVSGSD
ncbi:MAG: hypothetical protein PVG71_00285 [Anaerolineae bacterium]